MLGEDGAGQPGRGRPRGGSGAAAVPGPAAAGAHALQHRPAGHDRVRHRAGRGPGAAARGAIEPVLVDETRPLLQGARLTAWELAEAGIPHRLTIDSAAAWAMATGQVDCVWSGRTASPPTARSRTRSAPMRWLWPRTGTASRSSSSRPNRPGRGDRDRARDRRRAAGRDRRSPSRPVCRPPGADRGVQPRLRCHPAGTGHRGRHRERRDRRGRIRAVAGSEQIADIAPGSLYARGWMPGTAGNISVRTGRSAVITGSGLSKGELAAADMVTVSVADSAAVAGSAAPVGRDRHPHRDLPGHRGRRGGACASPRMRPPSRSARAGPDLLTVQRLRADQGSGHGGHHRQSRYSPIMPTSRASAREIERHLREHPHSPPVLFIAGHGITAWGAEPRAGPRPRRMSRGDV